MSAFEIRGHHTKQINLSLISITFKHRVNASSVFPDSKKMRRDFKNLRWFQLCVCLTSVQQIFGQYPNFGIQIDLPGLGAVRGSSDVTAWSGAKFYQFLGIPYGETTAGRNRYKPPIPKRPWSGVLDATFAKPGCPTAAFTHREDGGDIEDCLHLSVYSKNVNIVA